MKKLFFVLVVAATLASCGTKQNAECCEAECCDSTCTCTTAEVDTTVVEAPVEAVDTVVAE